MNIIILIIVGIIAAILLVKLFNVFGGIAKVLFAISSKIVPPVKLLLMWEYRNFAVIFHNLVYEKEDIFTTLKASELIGVVKPNKVHHISRNPMLKGIFMITWQAMLIEFFLNRASIIEKTNLLMFSMSAIILGVILGIGMYVTFKQKVSDTSDCFNTSTLGSIVEKLDVKKLSDTEIRGILSHLKYKSSLEIATKAKAGINSYPLLLEYFNNLDLESKKSKRIRYYKWLPMWVLSKIAPNPSSVVYSVFIEFISYMNTYKEVRASTVEIGHGGVSVLEHSLNVAECGLDISNHDIFKSNTNLKDYVVLTCLAHDIGKIKCFNDGQSNFNGHERESYQILGLIESFATLGDLKPELKDTVTTAILRQNEIIVNDTNENLVTINHIYKTADQKASELEGQIMTEDKINEIYRTAFYILLTDKNSMAKCASLVNGFLFLDVQKFVKELIKFTGQTFTVENYANTQVFKQIKKFMLSDGLFADGITDVCSIVMQEISSGKEIKRYQQCLILRMDFIVQNENIKLDNVNVNAEANNKIIAKLLFQDGGIQFVRSNNTNLQVSEVKDQKLVELPETIVEPDITPVQEDILELPNIDTLNNNAEILPHAILPQTETIVGMTIIESPNGIFELPEVSEVKSPKPQKVFNEKIRYKDDNKDVVKSFTKSWTLQEVNDYFIGALQSFGIEISEISWNKKYQRYNVKPDFGVSATVSAYIFGQISVQYSIYDKIDYADHSAKDSKTVTLPRGKQWASATIEFCNTHIDWNNKELTNDLIDYLKRLKLSYSIRDNLDCGIYDEYFAVKVKNFNNDNNVGIMLYSNKDGKYREDKSAVIVDSLNYIMVGSEEQFRLMHQIYLVDNLADALVLYEITNVNIIVYFSADKVIDKIKEKYPDKELRLFVNFRNYEKINSVIYKKEVRPFCYIADGFDVFNQKIIITILRKQKAIPLLSDLIAPLMMDSAVTCIKQLREVLAIQDAFDLNKGINNVKNWYENLGREFGEI
jgi:hypothetical protein